MRKPSGFIKTCFTEISSVLFAFVFIYASCSKLIDYQKFTVQLGQSPMLTHFAGSVAWFIPAIEIVIAISLLVPVLRIPGLYAFFTLMVMFSAYIIAITHYSKYVPCSCGGVLQKMTWNQHLAFNIFFVLLAATCILIIEPVSKNHRQYTY